MDATNLPAGQEQHEPYYSKVVGREMVQYDYRAVDGALFSCVALTLEQARRKRDGWISRREARTLRQQYSRSRVATRRGEMKVR